MSGAAMNVLQRVARGVAAHGLFQVVQLFIRLAEVPLFLAFWGANGYGEWLMVAALPTALSLSDGGFTKATQREMAMRAGKGDLQGVSQTFQSGWLMLLALTVLVIAVLVATVPWLPLVDWLNLETVAHQSLVWTLLLLSAQVCLAFQCALLYGAFAAAGRYATGTIVQSASFLLGFAGLAIGVASDTGMVAAAAGSLIGWGMAWLVMRFALFASGISIRYGYGNASILEMRRLFAPSMANLAFPAGEALNVQGMRLLVGMLFGPAVLAVFSSLRTLCRAALQPVLSISRTLEPELSLAYGARDESRVKQLVMRGTQAALWFSLALCAGMLLMGPALYRVWTSGRLSFEWPMFLCLLGASLVSACWCISLALPVATNRHVKAAVAFILIFGLGPIALTGFLAPVAGSISAAFSLLMSEICAALFFVYLGARMSGQSLRALVREILSPSALMLGYRALRSLVSKAV